MATNLSGVVGGTLSMDPGGGLLTPSSPSAVDVAMTNRDFAAVRGQKADERAEEEREQKAKTRRAVARRLRKAPLGRQFATRELILGLLSDDEVACVCTAEAQTQLAEGEEYLDLAHLERGVRRGGVESMARVLPKQAINASTWAKILAQLPHPADSR